MNRSKSLPQGGRNVFRRVAGWDYPEAPSVSQLQANPVYRWVADVRVYLSVQAKLASESPIFRRDFPISDQFPVEGVLECMRTMFGEDVVVDVSFTFTNVY